MGTEEEQEIARPRKKTRADIHVITPYHSIEQGWMYLASEILRLAIEDARQDKDPANSYKARQWLCSPMGKYYFEFFFPEEDINIDEWVLAGCPRLGKK